MELNLQNKVVVITGGSLGIGFSAAQAFIKENCRVAICARNTENLNSAKKSLEELGGWVYAKSVDVTDPDALANFAKEVVELWGTIDIWINNAGMPSHKSMLDTSLEEWNQVISTNLTSVFIGCKIAAGYMKEHGGVILNAGSFQSLFPAAGSGPYGATKAGICSLTRTFAAELACFNIRVLTYIPGVIVTPMAMTDDWMTKTNQINNIPLPRLGEPEDIANCLVFLASDAASYINGVNIEITGGKFCVQNPRYSWDNQ